MWRGTSSLVSLVARVQSLVARAVLMFLLEFPTVGQHV